MFEELLTQYVKFSDLVYCEIFLKVGLSKSGIVSISKTNYIF